MNQEEYILITVSAQQPTAKAAPVFPSSLIEFNITEFQVWVVCIESSFHVIYMQVYLFLASLHVMVSELPGVWCFFLQSS